MDDCKSRRLAKKIVIARHDLTDQGKFKRIFSQF